MFGKTVVSQDRATPNPRKQVHQKAWATSHYALLGLHPSASEREIRQAYRDRSKLYHPDTTTLSRDVATAKFQELNDAYATLTSPERRTTYDRKIGYSSIAVVQPLPTLNQPTANRPYQSSSAYLDASDRPLSGGELFALFILGLTFIGCLVLAIAIGITRGDALAPVANASTTSSPTGVTVSTQPPIPSSQPPLPSSPLAPNFPSSPTPTPSLPAQP
jgi:cell division septation protein DedD